MRARHRIMAIPRGRSFHPFILLDQCRYDFFTETYDGDLLRDGLALVVGRKDERQNPRRPFPVGINAKSSAGGES